MGLLLSDYIYLEVPSAWKCSMYLVQTSGIGIFQWVLMPSLHHRTPTLVPQTWHRQPVDMAQTSRGWLHGNSSLSATDFLRFWQIRVTCGMYLMLKCEKRHILPPKWCWSWVLIWFDWFMFWLTFHNNRFANCCTSILCRSFTSNWCLLLNPLPVMMNFAPHCMYTVLSVTSWLLLCCSTWASNRCISWGWSWMLHFSGVVGCPPAHVHWCDGELQCEVPTEE